ncbi:hypothetical protein Q4566_12240 [Tamlana sp. 2_MG-2023]|nr:hypothetical protein [Tamlana sp. 2_MG-2023]
MIIFLVFIAAACSSTKAEITQKEDLDPEEKLLIINETDFYTPPSNYSETKKLVTDYGADTIFNTGDSTILQTAIDEVSDLGCGTLIIPAGNYSFVDINLKSNVQIVVDAAAGFQASQELVNETNAIEDENCN